jgi:CHAT domain-containing protein
MVYIVPDAALQSLPFGVLVTQKPVGPVTDFAGYRTVPWLARRYATTNLPSVSSLAVLRAFDARSHAQHPFLGIGDPTLDGSSGAARGATLIRFFRGGIADVQTVRTLPALPESADELRAIGKELGAGPQDLVLRDRARKPAVMKLDFAAYRIVAFATHGLVAGDITGLAEPALVLTPPLQQAGADDDGLLVASDVSQLKFDADWVVLSACNTAAGDGSPDAEGLSGLAKAFFFAGSRTLLVSHWPVFSDATVKLTTGTFAELAHDPLLPRAVALQRASTALREDPSEAYFAHPMFWAPFIVVGEGGAQ